MLRGWKKGREGKRKKKELGKRMVYLGKGKSMVRLLWGEG